MKEIMSSQNNVGIKKYRNFSIIMTVLCIFFLLLEAVAVNMGNLPAFYTIGILMALLLFILFIKVPISGIYLLAIFIPMEMFQVIPGLGLTGGKAITMLLLLAVLFRKITKGESWVFSKEILFPLLMFIVWACISSFMNPLSLSIYEKIISLFSYWILIFLIINIVQTPEQIVKTSTYLLVTMILISFYSFLGVLGLIPSQIFYGSLGQERILGSYDDPNKFGMFILVISPFLYIHYQKKRTIIAKFFIACCMGIFIAALLSTLSRSAWLAGLALFIFYSILKKNIRLLIYGILISCVMVFIMWGKIAPRLEEGLKYQDESIADRIVTNQAAIKLIWDHPVLGVGLENSTIVVQNYKKLIGGYYTYDTAIHNIYLIIASETGTVGLLLYLWTIIQSYRMAIFLRKKGGSKLIQNLSICFLLAMSPYVIINLFMPFLYIALFWFVVGLCAVLYHINQTLKKEVA
jgi:putative inorganic carbon (hco3(-)) transporter